MPPCCHMKICKFQTHSAHLSALITTEYTAVPKTASAMRLEFDLDSTVVPLAPRRASISSDRNVPNPTPPRSPHARTHGSPRQNQRARARANDDRRRAAAFLACVFTFLLYHGSARLPLESGAPLHFGSAPHSILAPHPGSSPRQLPGLLTSSEKSAGKAPLPAAC